MLIFRPGTNHGAEFRQPLERTNLSNVGLCCASKLHGKSLSRFALGRNMRAWQHLRDWRCLVSAAGRRKYLPASRGPVRRLLLPLPNLGNCAACGIYFVFESAATGAKFDLLGVGLEKQHAAVADCTAGAEFSHAHSLPGAAFAFLGHVDSFAFAID